LWSSTLASWGWQEQALPGYIRSHIHPDAMQADQMVLISTFRLPTQIHTRSANSKWLDELAHTNPLWVHPDDLERIGISRSGDLVRVETEIGHFVVKAWVTQGIRPGIVACSHHMGRWRPDGQPGQRQMMATVALTKDQERWTMHQTAGVSPFKSADPDTSRLWWSEVGVHQNLTFPVHPDPVSGMHCWHQAVRVRRAEIGDCNGDVYVDTAKSHAIYKNWLTMTRPADTVSPDGTRRPYWLMRPLRPSRDAYALEGDKPREPGSDA
jgi:anaerobic selenocysteine-containing dehydrogenase